MEPGPAAGLVPLTRRYRATPAERALAASLVAATGMQVAFVVDGTTVWFAAGWPSDGRPWSPLVDLVQGVREAVPHPDLLLRRRILVTYPPDDAERALVRVAAQRVTEVRCEAGEGGAHSWRDVTPMARQARARVVADGFWYRQSVPEGPATEAGWLALADRLGALGRRQGVPDHARDRPVGVVAVDADGTVLCAARNLSGSNRVSHAELTLVQGWWLTEGRPLPGGCRLFVSWTPCRMCAAWIVRATESPGPLEVVHGWTDPGPLARDTALARLGLGKLGERQQ